MPKISNLTETTSSNADDLAVIVQDGETKKIALSDLKTASIDTYVSSIVGGANVTVDSTDPENPVVSATPSTSAGILTRLYATADVVNVNGTDYYKALQDDDGIIESAVQTVSVDDEKAYYAQDFITEVNAEDEQYYAGSYSGFVSVQASSSVDSVKFTVEVYLADADGIVIDSGLISESIGDLGVKPLSVLDTGIISLYNDNITSVAISGTLSENYVVPENNRILFHMSGEKVGTAGGSVDLSVYVGSSSNSYVDVPVASTTDTVINKSDVVGITASDALDSLQSQIDNFEEPTGLEAIDEGNGIGWRLIGRNPDNYGNIGKESIDFTYSNSASTTAGATGDYSFSTGYNATASGDQSFCGGFYSLSEGRFSFSYGIYSYSTGKHSVSLGYSNLASGVTGVAIGHQNQATGDYGSTALGAQSDAIGTTSVAIGFGANSAGDYSVAIGNGAKTINNKQIALGNDNEAVKLDTILEVGNGVSDFDRANALEIYDDGTVVAPQATNTGIDLKGVKSLVTKEWVQANGGGSSTGLEAIDEGNGIGWRLIGRDPDNYGDIGEGAVDLSTNIGSSGVHGATGMASFASGAQTIASGAYSHAEGGGTIASASGCHAEGAYTEAIGVVSHAEGLKCKASGNYSHAEGNECTASGKSSHSEGYSCTSSNMYAHSEGGFTVASGLASHAEGAESVASGAYSHAENGGCTASGDASHAEGLLTKAINTASHAQGKYNVGTSLDTIHETGIGTDDTDRKNAFEIYLDGTLTAPEATTALIESRGDKSLVTKEWVESKMLLGETSTSISSTNQTPVNIADVTIHSTVKLIVQAKDAVTGEVQSSELLIINDGTTAYVTEYALIYTGSAALYTYDVDIDTDTLRLLITNVSANETEYKIVNIAV